jgi:hypothetical protein
MRQAYRPPFWACVHWAQLANFVIFIFPGKLVVFPLFTFFLLRTGLDSLKYNLITNETSI